MRRFSFSLILLLVGLSLPLCAFYVDLNTNLGFSSETLSSAKNYEMLQLSLGEAFFHDILHVETSLQWWIDQRFKGTDGLKAFYFKINYGGVRINWEGLNVTLGHYQPHERIDTPYALFLNSAYVSDPLANSHAKPSVNIGYENEYLFFDFNWTALQYNGHGKPFYGMPVDPVTGADISKTDWEEYQLLTGDSRLTRAYNYKSFGAKIKGFSFAYQDAMLYSNRIFDWTYSLIPLPSILVQYMRNAEGNPGSEAVNDQSLMGVFLSYQNDRDLYLYGQFMFDDLSIGIFSPSGRKNPFKIAWSFGGWYQSHWGRFGVFHAGATKYTFQTVEGSNKAYTYNTFSFFDDGRFLEAQDTWIGYKNGENNISFLLAYQNDFFKEKLRYKGAVEFVLTGSQSPSNPWTEYNVYHNAGGGTRILDGPVETKVLFYNSVGYQLTDWLDLSLDSKMGFAYNAMTLRYPELSQKMNLYPYLEPGTRTKFLFDIRLTVRFYFDWKFSLKEGEKKPRVVSPATTTGEPPKFASF